MFDEDNGQSNFLDPVVIQKPKRVAKKKVAKKATKKKKPKKRVIKREGKPKEESAPRGKIQLVEGDDFHNEDIIKKQVRKIVKHNNDFNIQKLLDRFDPRFTHIVVKWFKDPDNKIWLNHRIWNGKVKWNDPEYIIWKKKFEGEEEEILI